VVLSGWKDRRCMSKASTDLTSNRVLARVNREELARIRPLFKPFRLEFGTVLIEAQATIEHAYFPISGILSAVAVMDDGNGIEVATITRSADIRRHSSFRSRSAWRATACTRSSGDVAAGCLCLTIGSARMSFR
jgi:CRP-like cAMP-binding protein